MAAFRSIFIDHSKERLAASASLDGAGRSLYGTTVRMLALAVATVGGVGYAPVAPGTVGSLVALPLLPLLASVRAVSPAAYAAAVAFVIGAAVWSAGRAEETLGGHDHARIVVDEVAGLVTAGVFLPGTWRAAALAFLLFRLFDVWKPFPAGAIDERVGGGLGVVGDDVVAGIYAGLVGRGILGLL
jgi:phosphatidylglycerophosphatase A